MHETFFAAALGVPQNERVQVAPVRGGDICQAFAVDTRDRRYFVKTLPAEHAGVLTAEAQALEHLAGTRTVRVPAVIDLGQRDAVAWLALEWLDLAPGDERCGARLGRELAALHRIVDAQHGWAQDNFIGRSPQRNRRQSNWAVFFAQERLGMQAELAARADATCKLVQPIESLMAATPALLDGHAPMPSLLHGDLWGGNWAATATGAPVLFDPAAYYGDRETDLAMTELFGGFGAAFYAAYRAAWPLDDGYERRRALYQLYHVLNHANLFGGGYVAQAQAQIGRLLRAI